MSNQDSSTEGLPSTLLHPGHVPSILLPWKPAASLPKTTPNTCKRSSPDLLCSRCPRQGWLWTSGSSAAGKAGPDCQMPRAGPTAPFLEPLAFPTHLWGPWLLGPTAGQKPGGRYGGWQAEVSPPEATHSSELRLRARLTGEVKSSSFPRANATCPFFRGGVRCQGGASADFLFVQIYPALPAR